MLHVFGQHQRTLNRALITPHTTAASTSLVNLSENFSQGVACAANSVWSCLEWGLRPVSRRRVTRMDS